MKDMYNIVKQFNVDSDVRDQDDGISVETWVAEMQQGDNSCVVFFFKQQGVPSNNYPELDINDFILVIMNPAQIQMLKQYGQDVICMDGTHGTNAYNFELTTVLVLDDLRQGFPCAFFYH